MTSWIKVIMRSDDAMLPEIGGTKPLTIITWEQLTVSAQTTILYNEFHKCGILLKLLLHLPGINKLKKWIWKCPLSSVVHYVCSLPGCVAAQFPWLPWGLLDALLKPHIMSERDWISYMMAGNNGTERWQKHRVWWIYTDFQKSWNMNKKYSYLNENCLKM